MTRQLGVKSLRLSGPLAKCYGRQTLRREVYANPSLVDNYELIQFEAPATGTYKLILTANRWNTCALTEQAGTPVAIAWNVYTK